MLLVSFSLPSDFLDGVWGFTDLVLGFTHLLQPTVCIIDFSPALGLFATGLIILMVMLRWEKFCEMRVESTLIPQSFLRNGQARAGLYVTMHIFFAYRPGIFVVVSFVQVKETGLDAVCTGLLIIPFALCLAAFSVGLPVIFRQRNSKPQYRIRLIMGVQAQQ